MLFSLLQTLLKEGAKKPNRQQKKKKLTQKEKGEKEYELWVQSEELKEEE